MRNQASLLIGFIVENRFEILSLIGEGGVAHVYKAKDRKSGEFVAIKVLKRHELYSSTDIERLKREARALQKLFHPNIIKAHSFGFLGNGQPYIVLDFLSGQSLEEYIRSAVKLPMDWTHEVLIQTCRGLACAHENGLIHRDLKPSNIMIIASPEAGDFVKLLDFGTAKSVVSNPDELQLTQQGVIFGSPFYISPEQISGLTFDKRADIYSFGCLMYETITGKLPYEGKSQTAILMKHLHEEPPALSVAAPGRKIPVEVQEIVLKCMKKNPDERYQKASDVEQALQKSLSNLRNSSKS